MKNIKELCILVFFTTVIFIRFNISDNNVAWLSIVNFTGLLVSMIDLVYSLYHRNENSRKIKSFIIFSTTVLAILMIPLALIATQYITVTPKVNDLFTLLALLITLSKQLFIDIVEQIYFLT